VTVAIGSGHAPTTESPLEVRLLQGICRGQRMDMLIQKSTELGICSIHPVVCERSVVRLDAARGVKKVDHWRQIAVSACEQSGRVRVPDITAPAKFDAAIADLGNVPGERLLLDPTAGRGIDTAMNPEAGIALLIGPEGGLTPAERELARTAGFRPVRLGPRILRTETAPLAALSILQYLLGDLG
jgi:16S rRNA (uracil1498-N3)-methyltransferase